MDIARARAIVPHMKTDVIIAGGGLAGTALAIALSQGGLRVALVDPVPAADRGAAGFDGRSYALSVGSRNLLRAIGVWDAVAGDAQPILDICISDGRVGEGPSPLTLHFDHAEIEEGPMGHMVEDRHLRPALLNARGDIVRIEAGVARQQIEPGAVEVTLTNGDTLQAAALVGCDGKRSGVAQRAGIRRTGWDYSQSALVAAISHEKPHEGIAHQFFMPEGPLAILPLMGNRASIVWTERRDRADALTALPDAAYLDVLRPRFGDFLGDTTLAGARFNYPLSLSIANRLVADRMALVGDAAHAVHPIAGQGLNAGLKDVAALAEVLILARRRGEDIGRIDVLERYQRWRRFDVATLALATDGFNRLFSNDNPVLRLARDLGLAAVQRLPDLRRGFIREAAGLTGDRPKLLQGQKV
ncbi:2-octaprenyl-6-methoxyphenol hydroxylase [Palleronia abyssalis]|uniref:2-octaprenyl-6-methoxyphenol hydroxylase n=2 Tax=Palleronia abyssalis TaxID=1501240 RepID=A0A2R8BT61_9RHOB|nr:2-octaprenyl-6-methoxyphenol hydroxylase [Palleronia abyssalis]